MNIRLESHFLVWKESIRSWFPGLTMAEISPSPWRYSTILLLWAGSTRANSLALMTAALWSSGDSSSNSRPVNDSPSVGSLSENTPIRRQIASAVAYNSNVRMKGLSRGLTIVIVCIENFKLSQGIFWPKISPFQDYLVWIFYIDKYTSIKEHPIFIL